MKLLTVPLVIVGRLLAVSGKLVVATGEVVQRVGRALGPKAVIMFVVGVSLGVVVGRRFASVLDAAPDVSISVPDLPDEVAVDV